MKNFVILLFAAVTFYSHQTMAAKYGPCSEEKFTGGELVYLTNQQGVSCWKAISGKTRKWRPEVLQADQLHEKRNRYQFAYIFADKNDNTDFEKRSFDPIFNVKIKEIAEQPVVKLADVELYREGLETLCSGKLSRKAIRKFNKAFREQHSGSKYNIYHRDPQKRDPGKIINDFHIWFLNSENQCLRTDDKALAKSFIIDDFEFAEKKNILEQVASILTIGKAFARKKSAENKYRHIQVQIRKGSFKGDFLAASFSLDAGSEFEVIATDLSSVKAFRASNRPYYFNLVNN